MPSQEPSANYSFVPLDEEGFQIYCSWFTSGEAKHWVSPPTRQWFDYIQATPGAHAWVVRLAGGSPVGQVQLDEAADRRASISLVVKPGEGNQGHGRRILRALSVCADAMRLYNHANDDSNYE